MKPGVDSTAEVFESESDVVVVAAAAVRVVPVVDEFLNPFTKLRREVARAAVSSVGVVVMSESLDVG
jgi:hypothetical protein